MHKLLEQQLRQWIGDQWDGLPDGLIEAIDETYKQSDAEVERLRRETRQARELEAVGRVAGGIAHDYNNLLTVIKGYCDLCKRLADEETPLGGGLVQISQATERAAEMTLQLLALSRRRKPESSDWNVNRVTQDLQPTLRRLLAADVKLELELEAEDAVIHGDRGRLQQLLLNLVIQAHDGLSAGDTIRLATRISSADGDAFPATHFQPKVSGRRLLLLSATAQAQDPGRERTRGLSVLTGLAAELGGGLHLEETEPLTLTVALPLLSGAVQEEPSIEDSMTTTNSALQQARILVVEDEEPVRLMLEALLTDQGHSVTLSPDPEHALEHFGPRGEGIDLLVTDIVMPGMHGPEMAEIMRKIRPDLAVLFISGYDPAARERRGAPAPGGAFLQKPFDASTLSQKIREVLKTH